ncbi:MAG TPA: hypothetical protein PK109_03645 [Candidatus Paceibacterota bacterium]|nr:hypothetical protein [Candidatus Paceibacterota bacterium]
MSLFEHLRPNQDSRDYVRPAEAPSPFSAEVLERDADTVYVKTRPSGTVITFRLVFIDAATQKESTENQEAFLLSARTAADFKKYGGSTMLVLPHPYFAAQQKEAQEQTEEVQKESGWSVTTPEYLAKQLDIPVKEYVAAQQVAYDTLQKAYEVPADFSGF